MDQTTFFPLDSISIVDVTGADAIAILHNLTTNEVKGLDVGEGCESFVTDVRGKTLGHVYLYCEDGFVRLIGAPGQSERIAAHIDRYTIREDATATIRDEDFAALVVSDVGALGLSPADEPPMAKWKHSVGGNQEDEMDVYQTSWLGSSSGLLLVQFDGDAAEGKSAKLRSVAESLKGKAMIEGGELDFHHARTNEGFPWMGIDLDESNLPQEADRDRFAISFTKGCYLGQETVARLDALGQVQKKLVRWSICGGIPEPGAKLVSGEKTVARLTSIAAKDDQNAVALGFARRSHFDPQSVATMAADGEHPEITATVI